MSAEPIEEKPMCQLSSMTPAELETMSKEELIDAALDGVTKSTAANEYDGKVLIGQVQTITDAYDNLKGTVTMGFTYYPTGEVDMITVTQKDHNGKTTGGYKLKHDLDGSQPEMLPLDGK